MLTTIREKTQGTFAWVILLLICVPFALWGLQNYTDNPQENALIVVGDKEFVRNDVTQAYAQFKQQYAEMKVPEEVLKNQAIEKLIRDELLLQHVVDEQLAISDETARQFIATLDYFQTEGQFDKKKYESLLGSQGMTSAQFVRRIRKALVMEQYQKAITETSFVTDKDIASFFEIQNQTRGIEYVTLKKQAVTDMPASEDIAAYYKKHEQSYQTTAQVSVKYVELLLSDLIKEIDPTEEQTLAYYEDNKDLYSKKERRKISHILFMSNKDTTEAQALAKATAAKARLATDSFATLAAELSDDTLTAKSGGDLGLFEVGVMEAAFEDAAANLGLGEVSAPVKSAFGYHLITVTELVAAETKAYAAVKAEVKLAVQRAEAETNFYELGESLTEESFENSDNLAVVAESLGLDIKTTPLFNQLSGSDLASEEKVRQAAFSEAVLQGNNSEPLELSEERLVVLRLLEHQPAETKPLSDVETEITLAIQAEQAEGALKTLAESIKQSILDGNSLKEATKEQALMIKGIAKLSRSSQDIAWQLNQAVFKAAKPVAGKTTPIIVDGENGELHIVNVLGVAAGSKEGEAEKAKLARMNIARALGQADYTAAVEAMRADTKVLIKQP